MGHIIVVVIVVIIVINIINPAYQGFKLFHMDFSLSLSLSLLTKLNTTHF